MADRHKVWKRGLCWRGFDCHPVAVKNNKEGKQKPKRKMKGGERK